MLEVGSSEKGVVVVAGNSTAGRRLKCQCHPLGCTERHISGVVNDVIGQRFIMVLQVGLLAAASKFTCKKAAFQ